jgi:hypothetical protein
MTEIGIDSWVNAFFRMKEASKLEALAELRERVNKSDNVAFKKEVSGFINGVRLVKSHEKITAAIEHHLKHTKDERELYGYIDRRIAVKHELIPSDWGPQQWHRTMSSLLRKSSLPGLRVSSSPLPRSKQKGRKPTLYITDDCDVESLFDARNRAYDPTNEDDALNMVIATKKAIDFGESRIVLYEELKKVDHPLFPDLTSFNMRSPLTTWLHQYLLPGVGGQEVWNVTGLTMERK